MKAMTVLPPCTGPASRVTAPPHFSHCALTAAQVAAFLRERDAIDRKYPVVQATFDDYMRHLLHILEVAGPRHVGIGADYDGTPSLPQGLHDVSRYPALFHELQRRRWSEADLKALAGANVLRALRGAESFASSKG